MTRILIIEDEIPARKKLRRFIEELDTPTVILAEIDTVQAAVDYLSSREVDVIFSDIELLDGNAFEIYQQVSVACPIIFTTAYDRFWMDAFESNGIAYLLKPFSNERFQRAWDKFILLRNSTSDENEAIVSLTKLIKQNLEHKSFKERFTIHTHQRIYFLEIENIIFFEANEGVIFAWDKKGKKHILSTATLTEIEGQLNPSDFFRINRSELISKTHIEKIERYTKNTLAISLKGYESYLKTSQSKTAMFREWLEK